MNDFTLGIIIGLFSGTFIGALAIIMVQINDFAHETEVMK